MSPEDKARQLPPATSGDEWDGPWGSISPVPQSVETLCVQVKTLPGNPSIHFYPYRTIGKWIWSLDQPETLEIQAGGTQVKIFGTGLRRLAEALNLGQLRLVRLSEQFALTCDISIRAIEIDSVQ